MGLRGVGGLRPGFQLAVVLLGLGEVPQPGRLMQQAIALLVLLGGDADRVVGVPVVDLTGPVDALQRPVHERLVTLTVHYCDVPSRACRISVSSLSRLAGDPSVLPRFAIMSAYSRGVMPASSGVPSGPPSAGGSAAGPSAVGSGSSAIPGASSSGSSVRYWYSSSSTSAAALRAGSNGTWRMTRMASANWP